MFIGPSQGFNGALSRRGITEMKRLSVHSGYRDLWIGIMSIQPRDVIRRLCNKDRDQGQKGIGVRYRSCSDIQYIG